MNSQRTGSAPSQRANLSYPPIRGRTIDVDAAVVAAGQLLVALGLDLDTEHLAGTPVRMVKGLTELLTPKHFESTLFDNPGASGLVVVRGIRFASLCAHHMLPFAGRIDIGYVPSGSIIGLSKLPRAVAELAAQPQIQEKLTVEVADWIAEQLDPKAIGVRVCANHQCMSLRGARAEGTTSVTSEIRGDLREDLALRHEWSMLLTEAVR